MKWLLFVIQLMPTILKIVQAIEEAVGPGHGDLKEKLLIDAVNSVKPMNAAETTMLKAMTASVVANLKPIEAAKKEEAARPQA